MVKNKEDGKNLKKLEKIFHVKSMDGAIRIFGNLKANIIIYGYGKFGHNFPPKNQ